MSADRHPATETEGTVRAAGGIVHRRTRRGLRRRDEVVLVHRPRYDDWTLPKGKRDGDETDEETALREVLEETGLQCALGVPAGETSYVDSKGRAKTVQYFLMEPVGGADRAPFVPNREVDELRWLPPGEAGRLLTYEHDRRLLEQVVADRRVGRESRLARLRPASREGR